MELSMNRIPGLILFVLLTALALTACAGADGPQGTPIPTLIAADLPVVNITGQFASAAMEKDCRVRAVDLLGAWVEAGTPETEAFPFTDDSGQICQATFDGDLRPLLDQSNIWFEGAIACTSCHGPDLQASYAQLDLSNYHAILAGSRRQSPDATGNDILGGGEWEQARLYQVLITKWMPLGRPASSHEKGPLVPAGTAQ